MSQRQKLLAQLMAVGSSSNLSFAALCNLLRSLGFAERIKGSHHIFAKPGVEEIINVQPVNGSKVKLYQAKQVRELLIRYALLIDDEDETNF